MNMKLKDVAELLQVSEKTVYRWVKDGKIPCCRINHQYRFVYDDIMNWIHDSYSGTTKNSAVKSSGAKAVAEPVQPVSLLHSVKSGGIYYFVEGKEFSEVLANAVQLINIPDYISREQVLAHLLKREEMASTAFGGGVAFPHPRNPMLNSPADENISICFLKEPVKIERALDKTPIHTMFIILSAAQDRHLQVMSQLAFVCRDENFVNLLKSNGSRSEIYDYIRKADV